MSTYYPEIDTTDLDRAAKALVEMSGYFADTTAVLEVAKHIAMKDMADRFDSEIAPDGSKWAPLSEGTPEWPGYAYKKLLGVVTKAGRQSEHFGGFIHPILTLEGTLRDAATSESAWSVAADSVWFDTSNLPPYWSAHQDPLKHNRKDLPKREFIGLSADAQEEILITVGDWIDAGMLGATTEYKAIGGGRYTVGSTYKGQTITGIGRGAGGRMQYRTARGFGPMV